MVGGVRVRWLTIHPLRVDGKPFPGQAYTQHTTYSTEWDLELTIYAVLQSLRTSSHICMVAKYVKNDAQQVSCISPVTHFQATGRALLCEDLEVELEASEQKVRPRASLEPAQGVVIF